MGRSHTRTRHLGVLKTVHSSKSAARRVAAPFCTLSLPAQKPPPLQRGTKLGGTLVRLWQQCAPQHAAQLLPRRAQARAAISTGKTRTPGPNKQNSRPTNNWSTCREHLVREPQRREPRAKFRLVSLLHGILLRCLFVGRGILGPRYTGLHLQRSDTFHRDPFCTVFCESVEGVVFT